MQNLDIRKRPKDDFHEFEFEGINFDHNDEEGFEKTTKLYPESKDAAKTRIQA